MFQELETQTIYHPPEQAYPIPGHGIADRVHRYRPTGIFLYSFIKSSRTLEVNS